MDDLMRSGVTGSVATSSSQIQYGGHGPDHDGLPTYASLHGESGIVYPRTIYIDGVLIFPSEPPATALYQLSRDLIAGTRITISRIDHEIQTSPQGQAKPKIRDRPIYSFAHQIFDDRTVEITGKRREGFACVVMSKTKSFRGSNWRVNLSSTSNTDIRGPMFLECKHLKKWLHNGPISQEWLDDTGKPVAVEERLVLPQNSEGMLISNPSLKVLVPLDQKQYDLLVTAWCARVWNSNLSATGQIRTSTSGKNAHFKG